MAQTRNGLAVVTGASTGIGYELAKQCAANGFDLLVAADEPAINAPPQTFARRRLRSTRSKPTWPQSKGSTACTLR